MSKVKTDQHVIDCDADPYIPDGWSVKEHKKGGQLTWDLGRIELMLKLNGENFVEGDKLRKRLKGEKVLNANVLDYLLEHLELIPEEWEGKDVFFRETTYCDSDGDLCVRCLYWDGGRLDWGCDWLDVDWDSCNPAAVLTD